MAQEKNILGLQLKKSNQSQQSSNLTGSFIRKSFPNLFSQILQDNVGKESNDPQFKRIKNNILLIILILSAYATYYLIGNFLDTILLAFIAGIAYVQVRNNFVKSVLQDQLYQYSRLKQIIYTPLKKRIIYGAFIIFSALILPWVRTILGNLHKVTVLKSYSSILSHGFNEKTPTSIFCIQFGLIFAATILIVGTFNIIRIIRLFKVGQKYRISILQFIFALVIIIMTIVTIVIIPMVLYRQVISTGIIIQSQIQETFGCQLVNVKNISSIPHCTQKLAGSQILKQTLQNLKNQNQTINNCINMIVTFQKGYLGEWKFPYQQVICMWINIFGKANEYFNQNTKDMVFSTSKNVFSTLFGNITALLYLLSQLLFDLAIFSTMFYFTIKNFDPRNNVISDIFSGQRKQLLNQITKLIKATASIVIEHFFMSFIILEIFNYSPINLLLSLVLSLMAFIPYFRPWFGALLLSLIHLIFENGNKILSLKTLYKTQDLYSTLIFVFLYRHLSQRIYSNNLQQMEAHQIIINMSVVFGIYQFGVAGIIYGPLILILFKCVHRQLMKKNIDKNDWGLQN